MKRFTLETSEISVLNGIWPPLALRAPIATLFCRESPPELSRLQAKIRA
jgi:hypothetical protein